MRKFKSHSSSTHEIMSDSKDKITEKQLQKIKELQKKDTRTEKQKQELNRLIKKRDNEVSLSLTAKNHCEKWLKEQIYNKKINFINKYTAKGIIVEQDSLDLVAEYYNYGLLIKNEERFENEYITGTPDAILKDRVIDVKTSWSLDTFPLFFSKINNAYWWQAQCYMELTGKDKYELIYVLMSTPDHLIDKEAARIASYYGGKASDYIDEVYNNLNYDNTPPELRIKKYDIEKNNDCMKEVKQKVKECRDYIRVLNNVLSYV